MSATRLRALAAALLAASVLAAGTAHRIVVLQARPFVERQAP